MGLINSSADTAKPASICSDTDRSTAFDKNTIIDKYPNLSDIGMSIWDQIVQDARVMKVPKDTEVYNINTRCKHFILLLEGNVRVYYPAPDGREITLYRVVPGDLCVLTLTNFLKGRQYNVIAKTEEEVNAIAISDMLFRDVMAKSDKFRDFVLGTLSERLCDLMCLVQDTVFQNLHVRIACTLDKMFRRENNKKIKTTHQALAHEIGTTREVISRILKEFEKENYIKISRGIVEIVSYDDIHRLAHPTFC